MKRRGIVIVKVIVWAGCLAPLLRLLYRGLTGGLGANPVEFITLSTGTWTLILLLASLAISPLRRMTHQSWLIRLRRLIGLWAFFYGSLHLVTYVWLDKFFDLSEIVSDVLRRPFITAGFTAYLLLVPLAATSTAGAIRIMGGRRWQLLHRVVYVSAVAGVVHFWWKVKADIREPALYASVLAVLLGYRLAAFVWKPLAARIRE